jgi:hypothetical protein
MSRRKIAPYTGILTKPRTHFFDYLSVTLKEKDSIEDALRAASERSDAEYQERLAALCTHYDIDLKSPHLWQEIIAKLAEVHVPGFKIREPGKPRTSRGAPVKWNENLEIQLFLTIEGERTRTGESVFSICMELAKKEPWCSVAPPTASAGSAAKTKGSFAATLRRRYHAIEPKFRDLDLTELLKRMGPPQLSNKSAKK